MAGSPKDNEEDPFVLIPLRSARGQPDAMVVRAITLESVLSSVLESCGFKLKQQRQEDDDGAS